MAMGPSGLLVSTCTGLVLPGHSHAIDRNNGWERYPASLVILGFSFGNFFFAQETTQSLASIRTG